VITSKASKISNARLNFVDKFGRVRHTVSLNTCSGVLMSSLSDLPQGSFLITLVGTDRHGISFSYNTDINATFEASLSHTLSNVGSTVVSVGRGGIAYLRFVLRGNTSCRSQVRFSSPPISGFSVRISPITATISSKQSVYVTVSVSVTSSRVVPGSSRILTLVASSGDKVIRAQGRIIIQNLEVI